MRFCLIYFLPLIAMLPVLSHAEENSEDRQTQAQSTNNVRVVNNTDPVTSVRENFSGPNDGVNFSEGTARINGQRIDPTQNRAFRSQFETYLTKDADAIEKFEAYQKEIQEILEILSPLNAFEDDDKIFEQVEKAYKKLYEAARYDADQGSSKVLAHMIFNSWRLRDEIRRDIGSLGTSGLSHFDEKSIHYIDKKMVESKAAVAKAQFETQIIYFLMQRRYDHAIMASYFYRMLFSGDSQELPNAGRAMQALEAALSQLGFEPGTTDPIGGTGNANAGTVYTVEAIEQLCQTLKNKIAEHLESLERTFENGEIHTSLERLQEVFLPGEYVDSVMTLPYAKRKVFLDFYRKHRLLHEYASAKDYEPMLKILDEIEAMTNDFFSGKGMRSEALTSMRISKFKLVAAKQALSDGDYERGDQLMKESVELWPLNPNANAFVDLVDEKGDATMQLASRFDEWLASGNHRKIFENKEELGLALSGDEGKMAKLKEVIRQYASANFIIEQAREMKEKAPLLAWDLLQKVPNDYAEDAQFLMARQDLLLSAQNYVKLLEQAKDAEQANKWNVAISYFAKALEMHPMSKPASNGIDRANERLLSFEF